jgi:hypothetical protein
MSTWVELLFLNIIQNGKQESNPWPHGYMKSLPLGYCFDFIIVRVIIVLYYALGTDLVQTA